MILLPSYVVDVMEKFRSQGYAIYVVGGGVRNALLGLPNDNWDLTTNAHPENIQSLFPDSFYHNVYGTVTISWRDTPDDQPVLIEITPFRKEGKYTDNRHPGEVVWADTIEEDLGRRDFTINAMAYDGEHIVDTYHGQKHLEQKLIVAVGDATMRFEEDALRLMRAVRFATQLRFAIEGHTLLAMRSHAQLITRVSWERIRDEFFKILASAHPAQGIMIMRDTGLLSHILPELDVCFAVEQRSPKRHHVYDVGTHCVKSLEHCTKSDVITRFATLIHDIGKAKTYHKDSQTGIITFYNHEVVGAHQAVAIAERFRLSKKDREKLVTLVRHHQFTVSELQTDKAVRRFIRNVGKEYLDDIIALRFGDRIGSGAKPDSWRYQLFRKRLEEVQQEVFAVKDLHIDGHDVMLLLGSSQGPHVGKVLDKLFERVVEGVLPNEREALIAAIKKERHGF